MKKAVETKDNNEHKATHRACDNAKLWVGGRTKTQTARIMGGRAKEKWVWHGWETKATNKWLANQMLNATQDQTYEQHIKTVTEQSASYRKQHPGGKTLRTFNHKTYRGRVGLNTFEPQELRG